MTQPQATQTAALDLSLEEYVPKSRNLYVEVVIRLIREKPLGLVSAIIAIIFLIVAIATPMVAPGDPNALGAASERLQSPSLDHWFGTDNLARDVYTRVANGARVSVTIGFAAMVISSILAVLMGVLSGYFGGWVDLLFQRFVDAFIAIPGLVLIVAVVAMFEGSKIPGLPENGLFSTNQVLLVSVLGVLFGVGNSRVIRGAVLSVMATTYIEAARSIGAGNGRMVFVHILPNVMAPVITLATLGLGGIILTEASLSFLGMGVTPDVPTWGGMLNREARTWMSQGYWWLALAPGIALSLLVFAYNMLGDALRDLLDPQLRGRG
ncbi:MAG: ABC transporter permease [Dehalococcoidia bacterium]